MTGKRTTLGAVPTGRAVVLTALNGVRYTAPVFGTVYRRADRIEVVLTRALDGRKVLDTRPEPLTDDTRMLFDPATRATVYGVDAPLTPDTLPEGTKGAHYCKQNDRHKAEAPAELLAADGSALRYVAGDKARTGFCPSCVKKHQKDAKARKDAEATKKAETARKRSEAAKRAAQARKAAAKAA